MNDRALKHGLGPRAVRCIAQNFKRVEPAFRDRAFVKTASAGLEGLELKARVMHIRDALCRVLPEDPTTAIDLVVRATRGWAKAAVGVDPNGFAPWPVIEAAGELGLARPAEGLEALRIVTHLFSAEFAIREFIASDARTTMKRLMTWTTDRDEHVRRLVSEGTRPRLPWGKRIPALIEAPKGGLALIERLRDDESEYVRRSVANHLNDVAKDHPALAVDVCRRWAKRASPERMALIRHALRTLVKQGDPEALAVLGFNPAARVRVADFTLSPKAIRLGEAVRFAFTVSSTAREAQPLVIDYAVHHVKKSGDRTKKTFKLCTVTLAPRDSMNIEKRHAIRKITTRTYHSGRHALEILINGASRGLVEFDLEV